MAMAIFNFVPTPSALETSTGSSIFCVERKESAELPMRRAAGSEVRLADAGCAACVVRDGNISPSIGIFMRDLTARFRSGKVRGP